MNHIENGIEEIEKKTFNEVQVYITVHDEEASASVVNGVLHLIIPAGAPGEKGDPGIQGIKGDPGPQGERGIQGLKGEKGDPGRDGVDGLPGAQGEQGPQGEIGPKGDTGEIGPAGPVGPKGDKGDKGEPGEKGEQGPQGLTGGVGTWFEIINSQCTTVEYPAAVRNEIYRGKNLTNIWLAGLYNRIQNGFEDLFIGDYFDMPIHTEYTTNSEMIRWLIAGFDMYFNKGPVAIQRMQTHHVVMVPKNSFTTRAVMNQTNTADGGYKGSYMYTTILPKYLEAINESFENYPLEFPQSVVNSINKAYYSHAGSGLKGSADVNEWVSTKLSLMSEVQVYGFANTSSSYFDAGMENVQLPLFRLNPRLINCKCGGVDDLSADEDLRGFWLRNISNDGGFCCSTNMIIPRAASTPSGVRPYFLFG